MNSKIIVLLTVVLFSSLATAQENWKTISLGKNVSIDFPNTPEFVKSESAGFKYEKYSTNSYNTSFICVKTILDNQSFSSKEISNLYLGAYNTLIQNKNIKIINEHTTTKSGIKFQYVNCEIAINNPSIYSSLIFFYCDNSFYAISSVTNSDNYNSNSTIIDRFLNSLTINPQYVESNTNYETNNNDFYYMLGKYTVNILLIGIVIIIIVFTQSRKKKK
jgi:hypothetical protein